VFNGVVDDITGSRVISEIDMAASHIGSNTISAHTTARETSPMAVTMFYNIIIYYNISYIIIYYAGCGIKKQPLRKIQFLGNHAI